jgi:hypothetical protein
MAASRCVIRPIPIRRCRAMGLVRLIGCPGDNGRHSGTVPLTGPDLPFLPGADGSGFAPGAIR